jgi:serine-type D-Ala-D-Ala endopeptidase (penicillin-binding protein 7)
MKRLVFLFLLLTSCSLSAFEGFGVTAKSWLVADGFGNIINESHADDVRSIASITKLMTIMVVLDQHPDLYKTINGIERQELIQFALVRSNNQAAETLCDHYNGGHGACIRAMNAKAKELGMLHTKFVDPTGLNKKNVSTAHDLVKLVLAAKDYPEIRNAAQMSEIKIKNRKKWVIFKNTNPIIGKKYSFTVSKTGFTNAAGGCIVMLLDTDLGPSIIIVLGSKNTHTRIPEAEFFAETY